MGAVLAGALAGCVPSTVTLNWPVLRATMPRTIAAPRMAARQALFGGVALPEGLDNVEITDPAGAIRDIVTQALARNFTLEVLELDGATPDLVLEIQTTGFTLAYATAYNLGVDPATMFLTYGGTLKLKDARTNEVLAEGACDSHPGGRLETIEGEQAAETLFSEVREAIEYCSDDYRHRLLGFR
ncbi:MAG TPA: hypothetical protein VKZ18_06360 [Polyangia bacterium]|nr:hypothetical protein [Polyangia bacterium]